MVKAKNNMRKEVVYFMPYETEEDIKKAVELRQELYDHYNSVNVYYNGLTEVRIVAENKIVEDEFDKKFNF